MEILLVQSKSAEHVSVLNTINWTKYVDDKLQNPG